MPRERSIRNLSIPTATRSSGSIPSLLEPLDRRTSNDTAHVGVVLNGQTKSQWKWTVTGNGDLAHNNPMTDQDSTPFPRIAPTRDNGVGGPDGDRQRKFVQATRRQCQRDITLGGDHRRISIRRTQPGARSSNSLSRTAARRPSTSTCRSRAEAAISARSAISPSMPMPRSTISRISARLRSSGRAPTGPRSTG